MPDQLYPVSPIGDAIRFGNYHFSKSMSAAFERRENELCV
jgi:hypothetical protein